MGQIENDEFLEQVLSKAFTNIYDEERDPFRFYPSSPSAADKNGNEYGECTRALYFDKQAEILGEEPDLLGSFILANGSMMGDFISKAFQKAGAAVQPNGLDGELRIRIERETPNGVKYALSGRVDQLARNARGQIIGYEFKTVYSEGKANRVLGDWRGNYEPDIKNVMQTAIYAWWGRDYGILDWKLTYFYVAAAKSIKKRGSFVRTYDITVDKAGNIYVDGNTQPITIHDIFAKYDMLADALETGEPPEREDRLFYTDDEAEKLAINKQLYKKDKEILKKKGKLPISWSACTFCGFKDQCWDEEEVQLAEEIRQEQQ